MAKTSSTHEAEKSSRWSRLKTWQKVLIIIAGLFLLFMIMPSSGGTTEPTENVSKQGNESVEQDTEKPEVPKKEMVEEWQDVVTVSGSSDKKTEPFNITGKRWKVIYTITRPDPRFGALYISEYKVGEEYGDSVISAAKESGETVMYSKGETYLDISSSNCSWTVQVQQLVEVEKEV